MRMRSAFAILCSLLLTSSANSGLLNITGALYTPTAAGPNSYSTTFAATENPISESSNWINGGTTGLDWTNMRTTGGNAIGTQSGASYTDSTAVLTGTWAATQSATATVFRGASDDNCYEEVELRLRSTVTAHVNKGYEISWKMQNASANAYLIVVRWNGAFTSFNYLDPPNFDGGTYRGSSYAISNGDVVSASITGNIITAKINGVTKATVDVTAVGGTVWSSGNPGMGMNLEAGNPGCSGHNGDYGFTDYSAAG